MPKPKITRNELRTQLFHTMKKILQPVKHTTRVNGGFKGLGKSFIGEILVGDLQETITTTSRDNLKGVMYKWHKHGILNAVVQAGKNMELGVFKYEGDPSYITREALSGSLGGRGISHIMVDAGAEQFYVGGCVDNIIASTDITTDHHIVAADFALQIDDIEFNQNENSAIKHQWGKISSILMDQTEDASEANGFRIWPKQDTPRTEQWHKSWELFQDLHEKLENDPDLKAASLLFRQKMESLQEELGVASSKLTDEEQSSGKLIERLPYYKTSLQEAWKIIEDSLKKVTTDLKLTTRDDPMGQLQKSIHAIQDPRDRCGHLRSTATFTSIIRQVKHLRATAKALHRAAKKVPRGSSESDKYLKLMQHFSKKLIFRTDQYKVGERLVEAIEKAEHQQDERIKIQDCYAKHRNLDKFQGEYRGDNSLEGLSAKNKLRINTVLKEAGCINLFDLNQDKKCAVEENEEAR